MKQFLKKTAIWFNHGLLVLFLFILPSAFLFTFIFSQPAQVKQMLKQSKIYSTLSIAIADATTTSTQGAVASYGLSEDSIRHVSQSVFSSTKVQKVSESFVDNTYDWLEGRQQTLVLELDLEPYQKEFTEGLSKEILKTTNAKPVCTEEQLQQIVSSQAQNSSLQAPCKPADLDINTINNLLGKDNLSLQQAATTAQATALESNPSAPNSELSSTPVIDNNLYGISIPTVFSLLKNSFYIILVLLVFIAGALYLLVREEQKYISIIAKPLLTTGLLLCVYAGVSWWLMGQKLLSKIIPGEQGELTENTISTFASSSIRAMFIFGITYVFCAVLLLLVHHKYNKKPPSGEVAVQEPAPVAPTPQQ